MDDFDNFLKNKENTIKQQNTTIEYLSGIHSVAWFVAKGYLIAAAFLVSFDYVRFALHDEAPYKEASQSLTENALIMPEYYI
jgi:hypothetical protein